VKPRITVTRCVCRTCGEYFNSASMFDRHRVGYFHDFGRDRRCRTVAEMLAKGWQRNVDGFWIERARLDVTRRNDPQPGGATHVAGLA
jgi:hypothetical protein